MKEIEKLVPRHNREHILYTLADREDESSIKNLISTLQSFEKRIKEKLYWRLGQYQNDETYSILIYTQRPDTDEEYRASLKGAIIDADNRIKFLQDKKEAIAKALADKPKPKKATK